MHPEAERRRWQNPESILAVAGLKSAMTFVDLGCGNGFFALPAARTVGAEGRVHGVDANPEFIEELRTRAEGEGLKNVDVTAGRAEQTIPCEQCGHSLHGRRSARFR